MAKSIITNNTYTNRGINPIDPTHEASARASQSTSTRPLPPRATELLTERIADRPVWVRAPKGGPEYYTGFCRSKLYALANAGHIRSVSIREPGMIKGTRLFNLESILGYIARCEAQGGDQ